MTPTKEYGYHLNKLITLSNENGNHQLEGYALQLDSLLASIEVTPALESFMEETVEFLYGLLEE